MDQLIREKSAATPGLTRPKPPTALVVYRSGADSSAGRRQAGRYTACSVYVDGHRRNLRRETPARRLGGHRLDISQGGREPNCYILRPCQNLQGYESMPGSIYPT